MFFSRVESEHCQAVRWALAGGQLEEATHMSENAELFEAASAVSIDLSLESSLSNYTDYRAAIWHDNCLRAGMSTITHGEIIFGCHRGYKVVIGW